MTKPTDFTIDEWKEIYYTPMFAAQLIVAQQSGKMGRLADLAAANTVMQNPAADDAELDKLRNKNAILSMYSVTAKAKKPGKKRPRQFELDTLEPAADVHAPELIQYLVGEVRRRTAETGVVNSPVKAKDAATDADFDALLTRIQKAAAAVEEKATPEESAAWKAWVMRTAEATAQAAKEKTKSGEKVWVSEGEKAMLERIQQALNA
jgi:site-specific recombinase